MSRALLCLALLFPGPALSRAAPAPLPRPHAPAPTLPVRCLFVWGSREYQYAFLRDGRPHAGPLLASSIDGRQRWVGTWRLDGRTLVIREREEGEEGGRYEEYRFGLAADLRTITDHRGDWRLVAR